MKRSPGLIIRSFAVLYLRCTMSVTKSLGSKLDINTTGYIQVHNANSLESYNNIQHVQLTLLFFKLFRTRRLNKTFYDDCICDRFKLLLFIHKNILVRNSRFSIKTLHDTKSYYSSSIRRSLIFVFIAVVLLRWYTMRSTQAGVVNRFGNNSWLIISNRRFRKHVYS